MYGEKLGASYAEAHHKLALGKCPDQQATCIEDLITVCANCHRMLHRMDGLAGDIKKLTNIVKKHRGW